MSGGKLLHAVIDTNLFISAIISPRGIPHDLLARWRQGLFVVLSSPEQRAELTDVLARDWIKTRYFVSEPDIAALLRLLDSSAPVQVTANVPVHVRDPKDIHIVAAAIGGHADYIVTGDRDILELDGHPALGDLRVTTATDFLRIL
jgi:putative PIN family toxin of toxin-antitoxin system